MSSPTFDNASVTFDESIYNWDGSFIQSGSVQTKIYTTIPILTWTPSPAPANGSGLVIPWWAINCSNLSPLSMVITDNQGGVNTYTSALLSYDATGAAGVGAISTGVIYCESASITGTFQLTATVPNAPTRTSMMVNHLEVPNLGPVDETVVSNSGPSLVTGIAVYAPRPNLNANSLVVATVGTFDPSAYFAGTDPPASGYASLGIASMATTSTGTAGYYACDAGWKIATAIETSNAKWPVTGVWSQSGLTVATLTTFGFAVTPTPSPVYPSSRRVKRRFYTVTSRKQS